MIELASNNPITNVGYTENNIMKELNVNEIEQVNGGLSMEDGGVGSLALAVTAVSVGAPFAAGFGLAIGIGLLWGAYFKDAN